jgi:hypothetical protein
MVSLDGVPADEKKRKRLRGQAGVPRLRFDDFEG